MRNYHGFKLIDLTGDRAIDGIDINKHIDEALTTNSEDFMQLKLARDLYFMPIINWHLVRGCFFLPCITSSVPNKNLLFCT